MLGDRGREAQPYARDKYVGEEGVASRGCKKLYWATKSYIHITGKKNIVSLRRGGCLFFCVH